MELNGKHIRVLLQDSSNEFVKEKVVEDRCTCQMTLNVTLTPTDQHSLTGEDQHFKPSWTLYSTMK